MVKTVRSGFCVKGAEPVSATTEPDGAPGSSRQVSRGQTQTLRLPPWDPGGDLLALSLGNWDQAASSQGWGTAAGRPRTGNRGGRGARTGAMSPHHAPPLPSRSCVRSAGPAPSPLWGKLSLVSVPGHVRPGGLGLSCWGGGGGMHGARAQRQVRNAARRALQPVRPRITL